MFDWIRLIGVIYNIDLKLDFNTDKGYWTAGVWTFVTLVHLILSHQIKSRLNTDLPIAVSAGKNRLKIRAFWVINI